MKLKIKNPSWIVGAVVLAIGILLLVFTFITAYNLALTNFTVGETDDLIKIFGVAFTPLINACIHMIYLGVMGWLGALITTRGVKLMIEAPKPQEATATTEKPEEKPS